MKRDIIDQDHYLDAFLRVINYAEGIIFVVNKFTDFDREKDKDPAANGSVAFSLYNSQNQAATAVQNQIRIR